MSGISIAAVIACAGLALVAPAGAAPIHAGSLDQSFGRHGRAILGVDMPQGAERSRAFAMAAYPGGEILVADSDAVFMFGPDGKLNPGFGDGGRLSLPFDSTFTVSAVVVDSQGRILVGGTSGEDGGWYTVSPDTALIARLLPDGRLDPGFGAGGVLATKLGRPVPPSLDERTFKPHPVYEYTEPSVNLTGLAVDAEGRLILTGSTVIEHIERDFSGLYTPSFENIRQAYLARLSSAGALDTSFGQDGVQAYDSQVASSPLLFGDGRIEFITSSIEAPRGVPWSARLRAADGNGSERASVDLRPNRFDGWGPTTGIAKDGHGRTLHLEIKLTDHGGLEPTFATRLLPSGKLDHSFGRAGRAPVMEPERAHSTNLGIDRSGRPLVLAGLGKEFWLTRITADGHRDRSFGRGGIVRTRFGSARATAKALVTDSRGRIVVGATITNPADPGSFGFALVRYLPGS